MMTGTETPEEPAYLSVPFVSEQLKLASVCADFNSLVFGSGTDPLDMEEREGLAVICFHLCHDHHRAIFRLFQEGHLVSGFAMMRPCFEALARGIWLLRGSSDAQLMHYADGRDTKRVEQLLGDIAKSSKEDKFLLETWRRSEKSLHKFTHVSYQLLVRRAPESHLDGPRDNTEVAHAMRFCSVTAMLASLELARGFGRKDVEQQAVRLWGMLYPDGTRR